MSSFPIQTVQNRITRHSNVHNIKLAIIQIPSYDSDDGGGGEEALIQDPHLDSLVRQVPPELLDRSPQPQLRLKNPTQLCRRKHHTLY